MPGSTSSACTRTSRGPSCTTRPTKPGCCSGRTCPCSGATRGSVRKQAIRQARKAVDLLGHHPSIALWCGHNVPVAVDVEPSMDPKRFGLKLAVGQQLPTCNRSILDRAVKSAFERVDGSRPVIAHSGVAAAPPEARRHRHAHLLRLVHRARARLPALLRDRAAHGSLRQRVRRASGAGRRGLPRSREVARPRLGARRPRALVAEVDLRSARAARGVRDVRVMAARDAGLPSDRAQAPHRDPATAQVPADRRVRAVPASRTRGRR